MTYSVRGYSEVAVTPVLYSVTGHSKVVVFSPYSIRAHSSIYVTRPGVTVYSRRAYSSVEVTRPINYLGYQIRGYSKAHILSSIGQTTYYKLRGCSKVDVQTSYSLRGYSRTDLYNNTIRQASALAASENPDINPNLWGVSVVLNGKDVTHSCTGVITIRCEEDAATIAEFTLLPHAGIRDATVYVNQPVAISFEGARRFTGVVDTPDYDPNTTLTHFTCTDGLQGIFEALDGRAIRAVADAKVKVIQAENDRNRVSHNISMQPEMDRTQADTLLLAAEEKIAQARNNLTKAERMTGPAVRSIVGGLWSASVFSSNDGWDAFRDCMSTQLASYNLDSYGTGVKTSWHVKSVPDFTFTEAHYLDQSIRVGKIANARSIVNSVDIKFEYRFTRLFEYQIRLDWVPGDSYAWNAAYGNPSSWGQCDHKRIIDAINGAGYCVNTQPGINGHTLVVGQSNGLQMIPVPPSGWVTLANGAQAGWMSDTPRFSIVGSFSGTLLKRYKQTVTETFIHSITAPQSIARTGRVNKTVEHALESAEQPNALIKQIVDGWEEVVTDNFKMPVSKYNISVHGNVPAGSASSVVEEIPVQLNRYAYAQPATQRPDNTVKPSIQANMSHWDMTRNTIDGRSEMNNAFATAKAVALRSIVESHRQNEVSFTLQAHTSLELSHTVRVTRSNPSFDAKGKVKSLHHTYDMTSGAHSTEVTLALIKPWSSGIHYIDPYIPLPDTSTKFYPGTLFNPTLSTWPPYDYNLLGMGVPSDLTENPPDSMRFRGYNYFTGVFTIEAPPTPQEAQPSITSITRTSESVTLPDDLFTIEA